MFFKRRQQLARRFVLVVQRMTDGSPVHFVNFETGLYKMIRRSNKTIARTLSADSEYLAFNYVAYPLLVSVLLRALSVGQTQESLARFGLEQEIV